MTSDFFFKITKNEPFISVRVADHLRKKIAEHNRTNEAQQIEEVVIHHSWIKGKLVARLGSEGIQSRIPILLRMWIQHANSL